MIEHRYILQPYKGMNTRHRCPACNSNRTFVLYIDTTSGEPLADHIGKCNREINCGYHYTPKQYFQDSNISFDKKKNFTPTLRKMQPEIKKQPSLFTTDIFKSSLKGYEENIFIQQLLKKFGNDIIQKVIEKYFIGTSKHWPGSTIFWQIDISGKIRTGKIMLYDEHLHRVKNPYNKIDWAHNVLKNENFSLKQSLYGEHLLKGNTNTAAIVESEKTAIIASIYLPQFLWLSCGNLNGLNIEKLKVLQGRNVILFPDVNAYDNWSAKMNELKKGMPGTSLKISDLLERKATDEEKAKGLDLADYLLRFDIKDFQKTEREIEPVNILIANIISIAWETITGKEFENMNIIWIKTNHGDYDVLFDKDGEPVPEFNKVVSRLAALFDKDFKLGFIGGMKCLAHLNN